MSDETTDVPGSFLQYAAYKAIGRLTLVLPLKTQFAIARVAADAYFKFDRCARENVCSNLSAVLLNGTPWELRRAARGVFQSFGRYLAEFFSFDQFAGQNIGLHVTIQGREHLDAALAMGRGAVICSGHYSNWELGAAALAHAGYPVVAVAQMHAHPRINALFVEQRARHGIKVVHSGDGARRSMKALRQNRVVMMLGDRPTGGPVVSVDWFGRPTELPQGPWRIALRMDAGLLPTFIVRRPDNSYLLNINAPIAVPLYNDRAKSVAACAQAWARQWEACVRSDPTQWEVFYSIWNHRD